MLRKSQILCSFDIKLLSIVRNLTSAEISTALRPFYFSVHPDLFGQYPEERAVNENSLQQLSSVLECLQASKPIKPTNLKFYVKSKSQLESSAGSTFQLIKIYLRERDVRSAILNILKSCKLPTDYLDKTKSGAPQIPVRETFRYQKTEFHQTNDYDFTKESPIFGTASMQKQMKEAQDALKLTNWLKKNYEIAKAKSENGLAFKEEIEKLSDELIRKLGLKEVRWQCGWNYAHYRGCLLAFKSLAEHHPEHMSVLKGRILIFSYFTGVSLDGHVMLYSGEVRHNWLDFIKNIRKHDQTLTRIPAFEKTLSHILRNIKIGRRKFMPKVSGGEYEKHLRQITTSLSDYVGTRCFPKDWPDSFENYEIVVDNEAGPLMVSPTGQFIVPSTIPGTLLVNFITKHLQEAADKINEYKRDKYVEKTLHKRTKEELRLVSITKDDNISPDLMIKCCQKLLLHKPYVEMYTEGIQLNVATYYSVLSDGTTCIPWNFEL